ncbi:MAG TPA: ABC transporter substrate-binding protein [Bradyrhizobium sp.]|jgi:putative ABC transport system substrate-binding protein|nr:ABC transporter substrate-binding protein [Bradyrhizobium sp.]
MSSIKRREFITLLGGAAAWPLAARAQQSAPPVIGFLSSRSADDSARVVAAFRQGLAETGYVEDRNVVIEFRWAEGQLDRLPALASELVHRPVAVIAALGESGYAAKAATTTIPIVLGSGGDPVELGLVTSLNRPGGNVTGATFLTAQLGAKRLGLLRDLVPGADVVALLINPNTAVGRVQTRDVQQAARALGQNLIVLSGGSDESIEASFVTLSQKRVAALLIGGDPFFDTRRDRLIALALQYRVPAIYQFREYALAGGLMSYGASITDMYHQVGLYVGRVLKGEKPADLPVMQVSKFETVINLKTAKALGIKISDNLLSLADEVIE